MPRRRKTVDCIGKMKVNIKYVKIRAAGKMIAELSHGDFVDENCSAAIFCTDAPLKAPELRRIPHRCVQFIDTEDPNKTNSFTWDQAVLLRDFLMNLPEKITTLYCCCDWGQSRSAGLAAVCMTALGQDCKSAFRNRCYTPNMLVYTMMCETLDLPTPADRVQELKRLRYRTDKSNGQENHDIKRIIFIGELALLHVIPQELFSVSFEMHGVEGTTIPCTEKELVADRKRMGPVLPDDLLLIMLGVHELRAGVAPEEVAVRMRKYLLWLRYINPINDILLALPMDSLAGTRVSREKITQLANGYRCLADDLQIPFVDTLDWIESTNARSVMEYLASVVKMDSANRI